MTEYESTVFERAVTDESTDLEPRDVRALTECMTTLPLGGDVYSVTTESGSEYRVDAQEGRCTCPDHRHRGVRCKHLKRLVFARGDAPIPAWADTDAVDPLLGEHCEQTPRKAAADGDSLEGEGTSEGESHREDCWCAGKSLPCFEHF